MNTPILTRLQPLRHLKSNWIWLVIPGYLMISIWLHKAQFPFFAESTLLLTTLNTLFCTSVSFIIAYIAGKTVAETGSQSVLWMGCGAFCFGIINLLVGSLMSQPNIGLTFYNGGVFFAGLCFLGSAVITYQTQDGRSVFKVTKRAILCGYSGVVLLAAFIIMGAITDIIPDFYIQGQGMTVLRQVALSMTVIELFAAAVLIFILYRQTGSDFLYWFSFGLIFLGLGIASVIPAAIPGGVLSWLGRFGQYIGAIFMLVAVNSLLNKDELRIPDQFQEQLFESQQKYRLIVENASEGIWIINRDAVTTYVNQKLTEMLGYTVDEMVGKSPFLFIDPEYQNQGAANFEKTVLSQQTEFKFRRKDGAALWVISSVSPLRDKKGNYLGALGVVLDITERKRFEQEIFDLNIDLKRRVTELQTLFNVLPMSACISEDPDCQTMLANKFFEELLAIPAGSNMSQNAPLDVKPNFKAYFNGRELLPEELPLQRAAITGKPVQHAEFDIIRADARVVNFYGHAVPLFNEQGQVRGAIGVFDDITERKQHEDQLRVKHEELMAANQQLQAQQEELIAQQEELTAQQEELIALNEELTAQTEELNATYQQLQRQSDEVQQRAAEAELARGEAERRAVELNAAIGAIAAAVIIFDEQGNMLQMNQTARRMFQTAPASPDLPYPERFEIFRVNLRKADGGFYRYEETPLRRALHGERIVEEEMMIETAPGKPVWLAGSFSPVYNQSQRLFGVIAIYSDITERKQRIADLLTSERELLKVTLNSLGEGVVAIDNQARIIFINETAANLIGCSQDEAIGKAVASVFYVFDDATSEPVDIRIPQNMERNLMIAGELCEVPIALNSSPIRAADGRKIGTVAVFQDITERLKMQQELSKADKLESLGILAGGIAHDFNNSLAAILSNVQLALMRMQQNRDGRKYLENTIEATRRASELTKQLLTFSKGGVPVRKDASLTDLIRDTAEFALRGAKVKAEYVISDDLWPASIDEGQISQVIHNLVINAQQAMPRGGVISICAANFIAKEEARFNPGNYLKITVQDQGIGIAKENLGKIFDPFFTTKEEGNGLGLATSYSIIRQHDGYLEVESQEGQGTTFDIYLPASHTPIGGSNASQEVAASGAGSKVLLMDDEEKILHAVGEMLRQYGYQVVTATDGTLAIKAYQEARQAGEPFDVVIMDLTVPGGLGGQETVAVLRDFDPQIKAIISSGYANDPIIADYERFGFLGVVRKPYKIDELNEILLKVINPDQLSLGLKY